VIDSRGKASALPDSPLGLHADVDAGFGSDDERVPGEARPDSVRASDIPEHGDDYKARDRLVEGGAVAQVHPLVAREPCGVADNDRRWDAPWRAARRRAIVLRVGLAILAAALIVGALVWIADAHYSRGVYALRIQAYDLAVTEFSSAKILVFPYRNAKTLEEQARLALAAEHDRRAEASAKRAAIVALLQNAGDRLKTGEASGVLIALQAIDAADLRVALDGSGTARRSASALAADLVAAAREALAKAKWRRVETYAAALLTLKPSSSVAPILAAEAKTGADLQAKLVRAKDAARGHKWREALRLALAVLAKRKGFPGAAAVVTDARSALKPKPKPAATQAAPAATTTAAPAPTGGTTSSTPAQPPPP
jgi:hypothetical protein